MSDKLQPTQYSAAKSFLDSAENLYVNTKIYSLFTQRKHAFLQSSHFNSFLDYRKRYWALHDTSKGINYSPSERRLNVGKAVSENNTRMANSFLKGCGYMMTDMLNDSRILSKQKRKIKLVLSLCAAPGGFCQPLVEQILDCRILAYSLSPESGGIPMLFEHERVKLFYEDVMKLSSDQIETQKKLLTDDAFDLILMDGAWASILQKDEQKQEEEFQYDPLYPFTTKEFSLKVKELILMIENLKENGIAIIRLNIKFKSLFGTVFLIILNSMFADVELFRPKGNSPTFWSQQFTYAICHNFKSDESEKNKKMLSRCLESSLAQELSFLHLFEEASESLVKKCLEQEKSYFGDLAETYKQKYEELLKSIELSYSRNVHENRKSRSEHSGSKPR